jgi:SMC interacting uncharacterized protein involved in chromosome segregation
MFVGLGTAVVTGLGVWFRVKHDQKIEDTQLREQVDNERKNRIEADTAATDSMTRRFQALMDGYEGRIKDLTEEVQSLRDEVKTLRSQMDAQAKICAKCAVREMA